MSTEVVTVQLADGPRTLPHGSTLAALVEALGVAPESVATAVDGCFVARGARQDWTLCDGQSVLLFRPVVGG